MPDLRATPELLVSTEGVPAFGIFPGSVARINGRDTALLTPMGKPASPAARHFGYKQFQYFGIISDRFLVGCALADTAWLGLAFVYLYDVGTGRLHEFTWRAPLAAGLRMSDSPVAGESLFRRGAVRIRLGYGQRPEGLEKTLEVDTPELGITARMVETDSFAPMSLCTRTGISGWTYANKVAGVPVTGTVHWQGERLDLAGLEACGHHDFSAGYMRRETFWNWACMSGRADGHTLGFNLSCGVNETGFTENCLWLDGRLVKVNTMTFEYLRQDLMAPWRIRSEDGQVDLVFHPEGNHRERMSVGVFATNFNQLFGRFEGELRPTGAGTLQIRGHYGFVEEQFARW